MKALQNLEIWLLYGGSSDERIRMGTDKAGYLSFLVFLFGGVGLTIYRALSGRINSESLSWLYLLLVSALIFSIALVARGATFLDTRKQRRALLSLGIFCVPLFAVLFWLFSKYVNIWYKGAGPLAIVGMAIGASGIVVLFVWLSNILARKRNDGLSRTK